MCGHSVERVVGETEVLAENLPQCHLIHHKSHKTQWEAHKDLPDCGALSCITLFRNLDLKCSTGTEVNVEQIPSYRFPKKEVETLFETHNVRQ
jgi:hypothetical protein